jgi:transcription-repair coupling factor (superfamily II helicase)
MRWIQDQRGTVKLRPDQKLVVVRTWDNKDQRVKGVQSLMKELSQIS